MKGYPVNNPNDSFDVRVTILPDSDNKNAETPRNGIETIRSSILLEKSIHEKFRKCCNDKNLVRACWLEAAFMLAEQDSRLKEKIEALAEKLTLQRKDVADDRRRVTMYENRKNSK